MEETREIAIEYLEHYKKVKYGMMPEWVWDMAIKALEQEPCKKGKWLGKDASGYRFYGKCSECGQEFCLSAWYTQNMKYCPNCGANMVEPQESEDKG